MSLTFTNILESDLELGISKRFPPINNLFNGSKPAILFPAGRMARAALAKLQELGVRVIGFGDSNPLLWGSSIDTLPVFSPQKIKAEYCEASILVTSSMFDSEITEMFASMGCKWVYPMPFLKHCLPDVFESRGYGHAFGEIYDKVNHAVINHVYQLLADDESRRTFANKIEYFMTLDKKRLDGIRSTEPIYFDSEIIRLTDQEVFVDLGAFIGDTLNQFLNVTHRAFHSYHAFEPDPISFAKLQQIAATFPQKIWSNQLGIAEKSGELRFLKTSNVDARIVDEGDPSGEPITVIKLDEYFEKRERPTFIKMDIEGSEAGALRGAAKIIAQDKPILAVSIYHYPYDLWKLPNLIHQLNPEYQLFIRHYTREIDDTVCYAIPIERLIS